jgi:anti-repressor protein
VDFVVFAETSKNPSGGRPSKEYAISLDMAKELSMVECNEQGRKVRRSG